jgi:hypothetical protein
MTTEERDIRFPELFEPAEKDLPDHRPIQIFWERRNRECGQRTAAHGVDVTQRVGRRDLAVYERIVDDGGEEIDGLHQRAPLIQPVHTGIVRGPIIDEDPVVVVDGQIAQDLGELTGGELARSTGAGGVIGQSLHS